MLVIFVFVPGLMEIMCVWMDYDRGMGPYRSQMTVNFCTIPANEQPAISKAIPGNTCFFLFFFV